MTPYEKDNLRFRKAYIRERLEDLKNERLALIAQREEIDAALAKSRQPGEKTADGLDA